MVCFVPIVCLSIRKSCQRRDCSELGTVRNWVDHCMSFIFYHQVILYLLDSVLIYLCYNLSIIIIISLSTSLSALVVKSVDSETLGFSPLWV